MCKRPAGELASNAPAGAQDVAGDRQFVGGCADIAGSVVEDKIYEMDQLSVDPQQGAGVGEVRALDKTKGLVTM